MGGGGGGSINVPSLTQQIGETTRGFQRDVLPTYRGFVGSEPILAGANEAASQWLLPILQSGGALTQDQRNEAIQTARSGFQARGNLFGNSAIFAEAMNRQKYRDQRFAQALGQSLGIEQANVGDFATLMNPLYQLGAAQLGAQTQANIAGAEQSSANKAGMSSLGGSALLGAGTAVAGIAI